MTRALITGASAGLGAEFARQLAASGHGLVLVARSADRLQQLADQLSATYDVECEVLPADLSDPAQIAAVAEVVQAGAFDVVVLNAGHALRTKLHLSESGEEEAALAVMVTSVLTLARAAAVAMVARGSGQIITVGSVAALMASGSYSAHKAWVRTFTEGLARSLRGTGVTATVVNPGLTHTEFHSHMPSKPVGGAAWAWLPAERVVADALAAAAAGKVEVTPSRRYRLASWALRHAPRGFVRRISRRL